MEETARRPLDVRLRVLLGRVDTQAGAVWLLGFLLVVYLGLEGGGYGPVLRNQLGIAVWWGVLLGLGVGALPVRRLRRGSWVAIGLLAAYVAWVALSATWSTAAGNTFEDLGRVSTYLGIFVLAVSIRGRSGARRMVAAVGSGIFVLIAAGLLSRLHPAWFPSATEPLNLLTTERNRLSYPLGYWNGVAELAAIGAPLLLYLAGSGRRVVTQALATAALPALGLAVYFTFSRTGAAAAAVGVVAFIALSSDRIPRVLTTLVASAGTAILIAGAHQRHALNAGLESSLAHHQGNQLLAMTLVVCVGAGLIQASIAIALKQGKRPRWSQVTRNQSLAFLGGAAVTVVVIGVAIGGPGKVSHGWNEFKNSGGSPTGAARFGSFSSSGRWDYWKQAVAEFESAPLVGKGSGSFEAWWAQHRGNNGGFVRDAHSLYLELLAELGIVGFALLVGFFAWIVIVGLIRYSSATQSRRSQLAAAMAGCVAFLVGAGFDWSWELAVIPISFLLLASVIVTAGDRSRRGTPPVKFRVVGCLAAIVAMVAIGIPLATAHSLQASQAAVREGNLEAALHGANDARSVEPFAAAPRIQQALVQERLGNLAAAERAAHSAVAREPYEWRSWVILSRLQAERGKISASIDSYRKARSLNPHSALFRE
jgi:O-Antigen ligase